MGPRTELRDGERAAFTIPPNLHTALWASYRCRQLRTPPRQLADWLGFDVLEVLRTAADAVPRPLLGAALWNLAQGYGEPLPKELRTFADEMLGPNHSIPPVLPDDRRLAVFPFDQGQVVLESSWRFQEDFSSSTVEIELCVHAPFGHLKRIVDPHTWGDCPLFWAIDGSQAGKGGGTAPPVVSAAPVTIGAQLNLPVGGPIDVKLAADVSDGPFETRVDFELMTDDPKSFLSECRGYLSTRKERGRPGVTRIAQSRTVRFASGPLNDCRLMTIAYWLQAEIVYFVLARADPR